MSVRTYERSFLRQHPQRPNGFGDDARFFGRAYPRLPYWDAMPLLPRDDNVTVTQCMRSAAPMRPIMVRLPDLRVVSPPQSHYLFQDRTAPLLTYGSAYYDYQSTPDRLTVPDGATDLAGNCPIMRRGGIRWAGDGE